MMSKTKNNWANSLIRFHLYAFLVLIPLVFWLDFQTVFTAPKLLILRVLSLTALGCILLKSYLEGQITLKLPKAKLWLGLWLLSMIVSSIFTLNQITSLFGQYGRFTGLFTMVNFLLIPIFTINYFDKTELPKLLRVSCFTALLVALYGVGQYYNFGGLLPANFGWSDSPQNRIFATVGHANHLGAYLAAHLVMFCSFYQIPKKPFPTILLKAAYTFVLAFAIILTASRGALFALLIGLFTVCAVAIASRPKKARSKKFTVIFVSIATLLIAAASIFAFKDALGELALFTRTEQSVETANKGIIPDRLSFLYSAWAMFIDHPVVGTGLGTFRDAYSAYRRSDYIIDGPGNAQYITVPEAAHNEYANILATQGLLGILAYLFLIGSAIRIIIKALSTESAEQHGLILALLGGLTVYLAQTLFNFGEIVNLSLFYFLLGAIYLYAPLHTSTFKFRGVIKYLSTLIVLVLICFAARYLVIDLAKAEYYLKQAKYYISVQNDDNADRALRQAIDAYPYEYQLRQSYGDFLLATPFKSQSATVRDNGIKKAVQEYQEAINLNSNYPSTYHNLGLGYLYLYRVTQNPTYLDLSKQAYQRSVEKSPNNPRYLYEFARKLHSDWDDKAGAVDLLRKAIAIAPNYQEPKDYLDFLFKNHPELASPLN